MYKELETPIEVKRTQKYRKGRKKVGCFLAIVIVCLSIVPIGFWVTTFGVYAQSPTLSYILGFFASVMTYMVVVGLIEALNPEDMRNLPPE